MADFGHVSWNWSNCMKDKSGQTTCCFCGKDLNKEFSVVEIRGGIGNKVLAKLCDECGRKYRMLQQNRSLLC